MRTCPVAPLVMGHPTAVSGAMQLLSPHLACLFEWGLGSGEGSLSWKTRNNFRIVMVKHISVFHQRWGNGGSFDWFAAD